MLIRVEEPKDGSAVHAVDQSAFGTSAEARLVEALRKETRPVVSRVAEEDASILGHLLFSPVALPAPRELKIVGLAPMAVVPAHQRKGIGSALVRAGLEQCSKLGFGAAVVLGHPDYYPRFGLLPVARFGIGCEYEVPAAAFMLVELQPRFLRGASGKVKYHEAFSKH